MVLQKENEKKKKSWGKKSYHHQEHRSLIKKDIEQEVAETPEENSKKL